MACCVAVWWMFRGHGAVNSPWLLAYGMVVMFIGQGVNFSRKNRLVLTILLQLIILMVWVLSQAYEGIVTSFMIQPIHEHRLETFDDLIASNFDILSDEGFRQKIHMSSSYKLLKSRLYTSATSKNNNFTKEILRKHFVFILTCDQIEDVMNRSTKNGTKVANHYYLMNDILFPYFERLEASYLNPFIERLQYYMDLCFQAGLPYIWKVFTDSYRTNSLNDRNEFNQNFLMLKDLMEAFYLLIIGYLLSIALILVEIFYHDILQMLRLSFVVKSFINRVHQMAYKKKKTSRRPKYQKGALYYIIHRHKRVKRLKARKLKVRRIYVQPRFPMD